MRHLRQLGNQFSIPIPADDKGYIGRGCPDCQRYFKITLGTRLSRPILSLMPFLVRPVSR